MTGELWEPACDGQLQAVSSLSKTAMETPGLRGIVIGKSVSKPLLCIQSTGETRIGFKKDAAVGQSDSGGMKSVRSVVLSECVWEGEPAAAGNPWWLPGTDLENYLVNVADSLKSGELQVVVCENLNFSVRGSRLEQSTC